MAKVFADDITLNYNGNERFLSFVDCAIYDSNGNNNGHLDPGETADLATTLKNVGGVDFIDLSSHIECSDSFITIIDDSGYFGSLVIDEVKENRDDPYTLSASQMTPMGHVVDLRLITTERNFIDTFNFRLIVGPYHYLVWDPDSNPSSGPVIDDILSTQGFIGDYKRILPSSNQLSLYQTVFVCAGVYPHNHIIEQGSIQAYTLIDYLYNGGNVYLEGGDVWYYDPRTQNGHDFGSFFGINATADGSGDMGPIVGQNGTFATGMYFDYEGENEWMDHISPDSSAIGSYLLFADNNDNYDCGVAYDNGVYRTLGVSFELHGLVDSSGVSTKAVLLDSIMNFFAKGMTIIWEENRDDCFARKLSVYPNPFSKLTEIRYQIDDTGCETKNTTLRIYDATGRLVKDLSCPTPNALSSMHVVWNGRDDQNRKLPSGVYFLQFQAGDHSAMEKILLIK